MRAAEIVADELTHAGHTVLSIHIAESVHSSQRHWPAIVAVCCAEPDRYDWVDAEMLLDEELLREWIRIHWVPACLAS